MIIKIWREQLKPLANVFGLLLAESCTRKNGGPHSFIDLPMDEQVLSGHNHHLFFDFCFFYRISMISDIEKKHGKFRSGFSMFAPLISS
jgi:hypothetical protein